MANNVHSHAIMSPVYGKILVVEDDKVERESLAELLRLWGYQVTAASDGHEALQRITSSNFGLIISDAHMPNMSGLGLLRELRRNFHSVRCIIISADENALEGLEPVHLGAYGFLKKPIDPDNLRAEIQRCLEMTPAEPPRQALRRQVVPGRSAKMPEDSMAQSRNQDRRSGAAVATHYRFILNFRRH